MSKAKAKAAPKLSLEQRLLLEQLKGISPSPVALPEARFHPTRKWRIDVAVTGDSWGEFRSPLAIEIDGGVWLPKSRHTTGKGFTADLEKMNALTELGWRVLRFTPQQVRDGSAIEVIRRCL